MTIVSEMTEFLTAHLERSRQAVDGAIANFNLAKAALDDAVAEHAAVEKTVAALPTRVVDAPVE